MHCLGHGDARIIRQDWFSSPTVSPCSCGFESGARAFLDEALLELRERREDRKNQFARRRRRINGSITQGAEADPTFPEGGNQGYKMGHGATKPIKSPHQQHVPRL